MELTAFDGGLPAVEACAETKGDCPKTMDLQNIATAIMHNRNSINSLNRRKLSVCDQGGRNTPPQERLLESGLNCQDVASFVGAARTRKVALTAKLSG